MPTPGLIKLRANMDKLALIICIKIEAVEEISRSTSERLIIEACKNTVSNKLGELDALGITRQGDGSLSRLCEPFEATDDFPAGYPISL